MTLSFPAVFLAAPGVVLPSRMAPSSDRLVQTSADDLAAPDLQALHRVAERAAGACATAGSLVGIFAGNAFIVRAAFGADDFVPHPAMLARIDRCDITVLSAETGDADPGGPAFIAAAPFGIAGEACAGLLCVFDIGPCKLEEGGRRALRVYAGEAEVLLARGSAGEADAMARRDALLRLAWHSAEADVARAERLLAEWDADIDLMAYTLSHDLRSPLHGIAGFAQLIATEESAAASVTVVDFTSRIMRAAYRMEQLINGMTEYLRLARVVPAPALVPAEALARTVIRELKDDGSGRKVEWELGVLPEVWADADLLRRAFGHLLGNAFKFTRRRDVARIEITATRVADGVRLSVRDNGAGFEPRYARRLFTPGTRLHAESEFAGAGMGLACVRRIAERHGGHVSFESSPNAGATFHLWLPEVASGMPVTHPTEENA